MPILVLLLLVRHNVNVHACTVMAELQPGDQHGPARKKSKGKGASGKRCVMYGCSNTIYDGFSVHVMPKNESVRRAWIRFIKNSVAHFNPNERKCVTVCSGHFDHSQYDQSQLQMFRRGLRSYPPRYPRPRPRPPVPCHLL